MTDKKIESLLTFPCEFPIKVIAKNSEQISAHITEILQKHLPTLTEDRIKINPSKEKKYTAYTLTIIAESQLQLDAIYLDLNNHSDIIMVL